MILFGTLRREEGRVVRWGGDQICAEGGFITVPKQLVVWSMSSLKFILFERGRIGDDGDDHSEFDRK